MLIRHSIIYFIGKLAPAILSLIGVMIFTRMVTPEAYGLFSLITVITGLINILFFQWIRSSFIRFYNEKENIKSFSSSIVRSHIFTLGILLIPIIILLPLSSFYSIDLRYIIIGYFLVVFLSLFEMCVVYYRTILKPKIVVNLNVLKSLLVIFCSTILLYFGWGVWGLLFGSIIGTSVGVFPFVKKIRKNNIKVLIKADKRTQLNFFKYGMPITLSFVLSVALQNIDKIMISSILGLEANGNYAVGFDLIHNLIYMLMTSLSLASFPLILKVIKKSGDKAGKKQFQGYVDLLLFISIPACFGLASILNEFTTIVIGDSYSISNHLMILIIIASLFHGMKSYYFDLTLQISTKTKYFFIPVLTAIIINVIFNFFLLNKFGIEGAAIATALAFFIAMFISAFYSIRNYHVPFPWTDFFKIIVSSYVMYLIVTTISIESNLISLITKILVGIIVYVLVSIIINSLKVRELIISKLMKR